MRAARLSSSLLPRPTLWYVLVSNLLWLLVGNFEAERLIRMYLATMNGLLRLPDPDFSLRATG